MRWQRALRTAVVDTATAQPIGRVDNLVVDPDATQIVAIVVGDKVVGFSDAGGIGVDAVTVQNAELLREPASDLEQAAVKDTLSPISKSVITDDGVAMGTVSDIDFDRETGNIERILLSSDDLRGSRLLGVGSYAVVVRSGSQVSAAGDLSSLTRDELYEMAKERDIDGRSSMDKQQLVDALG